MRWKAMPSQDEFSWKLILLGMAMFPVILIGALVIEWVRNKISDRS